MKDIASMASIRTSIFQTDSVPLAQLLINQVRQHLMQGLAFKAVNFDEKQNTIQFTAGEFTHDDRVHLIEAVVFDDRRVSLKAQADTSVADACFEAMLTLLAEQESAVRTPALSTSYDSSFVASLDFDFREIFSPVVREFVDTTLPRGLADEGDAPVIAPRTFAIDVMFPQTASMAEVYMAKQGRQFAIEPRSHTSLAERRYYCTGPIATDRLLQLVQELEESVVRAR